MSFDLENLVRPNVRRLKPYSSARKEFSGTARVFLDANENSFGSPLPADFNRYPDPLQTAIKEKIATLYDIGTDEIFVGNGSDEAIDLLFRVFCRPQIDECLILPPTYGMYEISAEINDVKINRVLLTDDFQIDLAQTEKALTPNTKLLFICSPNNPTGNLLKRADILHLARNFHGIVVVDEAYIHFAETESLVGEIKNFPNLVVLQTFSKAWGLAGLRVGLAFGSAPIIAFLNKVKPPYNVSQIAQEAILEALTNKPTADANIAAIISERRHLSAQLSALRCVEKVFSSDANFILLKTRDADGLYGFLLADEIVVRNRHNVELCSGCLRVTIGTPTENELLLKAFEKYEKSFVY